MKPFLLALFLPAALALDASAQGGGHGKGQGHGQGRGGMPEAEREAIHGLFESHSKITRELKRTKTGYVATTTSKDPAVAKLLRSHVAQMEKRLDSGLRVRRWDPAFDEFVAHYKDIDIKIDPVEGGLRVTANGKTPAAIKVARNHAEIISKFVAHGWEEHDVRHPAVGGGKE